VILGKAARPEPRLVVGETGLDSAPVLGRDVDDFDSGSMCVIDNRAAAFPIASLATVPAGDYWAQAVLATNRDLTGLNAPGNLYSDTQQVHVDPAHDGAIQLVLRHAIPSERLPPDTEQVKFLRVRSKLLSDFHHRQIDLRAGVILPRDFAREPQRRYPLRVHIGGFATRFTAVNQRMAPGTTFRELWDADDTPRMILLQLDGAGPLGDPYQVNSANHGPYGDAITQELIPLVESKFRAIGQPHARVLDGGSTGGWVALALQVFYPDFFNGAWSFCPDGVDFRSFQLLNIHEDANAYVNSAGFERPAARDRDGDVRYTMRHECQLENVLGAGNSWAHSGGQWGSWNATYGPRGKDGRPVPLWDPKTGKIDRNVAEQWKAYDLRWILERDWKTLGPKLRGKIHIWVGEADDFFLNNAVHRLDEFLSTAEPPYEGTITYGMGKGHCWMGISEGELMKQMAGQLGRIRQIRQGDGF
jgi:S-formylglutathione hydrolase FrmB